MEGLQAFLISFLMAFLFVLPFATAELSTDYYAKICPNLEKIVLDVVTQKVKSGPIPAPGVIRLFFHDCFVNVRLLRPTEYLLITLYTLVVLSMV